MSEETGSFDPNNSMADGGDYGFPQAVEENLNLSADQLLYHHQQDAAAVSTMGLDLQHHLPFDTHWMHPYHHSTSDIGFDPQQTPDLLNPFHLPNSNHDSAPFSFIGPSDSNSLFQINLPPQLPLFRETGKRTKHFVTERERRVNLNDRYKVLGNLVPSLTKTDRASIVGDAIEYIKELRRTVDELKILVEKKRSCGRERSIKRHKTDQDDALDQSYNNGSLRSSWIHRKSKDTEVDVHISADQVTITLLQRKKMDCLLLVSKVLDELQLDLHHVAGGQIGGYYSYLFNTKIDEDSSIYAGSIANKFIEVMDTED